MSLRESIASDTSARQELAPAVVGRFWGIATFAIPLAVAVAMPVVGTLHGSDLLALLLLPFAVRNRRWLVRDARYGLLATTGVIWLGGQVISDVANSVPIDNALRGSANIIAMLSLLFVLGLLIGSSLKRARLAILGLAAGIALQVLVVPSLEQQADPLKFGGLFALALFGLAGLSLPSKARPLAPAAFLLGLGVYGMASNVRAGGGVLILASCLIVWGAISRPHARNAIPRRIFVVALSGIVLAGLIVSIYGNLARTDALGSQARDKYELQQSGSLGVLVGGRLDSFGSLIAIKESPVIGFGSWSNDDDVVLRVKRVLIDLGYSVDSLRWDRLPTHSYVLGAWVQAGLLALPFWIVVCCILATSVLRIPELDARWIGIAAFIVVGLAWEIVFSPFGGIARTTFAVQMTVLMTVLPNPARTTERGIAALPMRRMSP